jgi:hypothetical protein
MKTNPNYSRNSTVNTAAMKAWLHLEGLRVPKAYDDDEDDGMTNDQRIEKVARLMRKIKSIRKSIGRHRIKAMESLRMACPEIDENEMKHFVDSVKARGRAEIINIEKIKAKARKRLGVN